VVENVERIMEEEHLPPKLAADKAIRQVAGALVAIVLSLCAVFVPVAFLSGITGAMYKEIALTIVIAVVISGLVALTLTPALAPICSSTRPRRPPTGSSAGSMPRFDRVRERYLGAAGGIIARPRAGLAAFVVMVGLAVFLFRRVPSADRGQRVLRGLGQSSGRGLPGSGPTRWWARSSA
jgi:multidrug efflux pump subunit AcrB